jgi:AcrR family transcriptional regulator
MPKIVDREEMQIGILDAAQTVYLDKGYHSATIADVADAAGVAKGTIYLYYKNKEALAEAMMHNHFDGMQDRFFGGGQPATLDAFARSLNKTMKLPNGDARYIRLFFEVFGEKFTSDEFMKNFGGFFERLGDQYAGYIAHLQDLGEVRKDADPRDLGRLLAAMVDGIILHRGFFSIPESKHAKLRGELAGLFVRGLAA